MYTIRKLTFLSASIALGGLTQADVILDIDYTAAEGYTDGNLQFQNGWLGQASAQVDSTGTGTVTSNGGPFDRNCFSEGVRGGTGGVPAASGDFLPFESVKISFEYQFILSNNPNGNFGLCTVGIRPDGPNAGNGFSSSPVGGFKLQYNNFDDDPTVSDDGAVKFFADLNDNSNGDAMFVEGIDLGISPGTEDSSPEDFESDPLLIEYTITKNSNGGWTVTNFQVTNQMTSQTFVYGAGVQTFDWFETDPLTDPYLDAFYAQQLAPNSDTAFVGTSNSAKVEYFPAPAVRSAFDFDFTAAEGFVDGSLVGQLGWGGQSSPMVDSSGSGTATAMSFLRNYYSNGLLGSSNGDATTAVEKFNIGESVEVVVDYKFVLPDGVNDSLGKFGFRFEGPNIDNNFDATPIEGFSLKFNSFNADNAGGLFQCFPDTKDESSGDNNDILFLSGNDVGIDPYDDLGGGADFESDLLRFTYTLLIDEQDPLGNDGIWDGLLVLTSFEVENLNTQAVFTYSGNPQQIFWNDTADEDGVAYEDLFFAQQYVRSTNDPEGGNPGSTGIVDRVAASFIAVVTGGEEIVVNSVEITGGNFVVTFTGTPGASYKLTESADLTTAFVDTDPLQTTTADGTTGVGTLSVPVGAATKNFFKVEDN